MPAKNQSAAATKQVEFISGTTDILIIAPHGVKTRPRDDTNTDILGRRIAEKLGCSALMNDSIKRTKRDYNTTAGAGADPIFMANLRSVLDAKGPTLVVWIHGIGTAGLKSEIQKMRHKGPLDCLIGYGQPDRHSIPRKRVRKLIALFNDNGIIARETRDKAREYRGRASHNMNQWFRQHKKYRDQTKVQSVQLEFAIGKRRSNVVENTAESVFLALSALVRSADAETVI